MRYACSLKTIVRSLSRDFASFWATRPLLLPLAPAKESSGLAGELAGTHRGRKLLAGWGIAALPEDRTIVGSGRPEMVERGRLPRVLLVEDAPFLRYAFARLLRLQGFEVSEATDGAEAHERITEQKPDMILTEVAAPSLEGVELIRRIRSNPLTADVPIVAITASPSHAARTAAREAGANDVIDKPVDLPWLIARMRSYVRATA